MKKHCLIVRFSGIVLAGSLALSCVSCMTTYDAYGRPVQSVDPGLAVAGIAAAGLIGYAAASDNGHDSYDSCGGGGYYGRPRTYSTYVSRTYSSGCGYDGWDDGCSGY